jgi:glycosidase
MTLPGAPSIYYGDEIGLAGGNDPACRGAFPWDRGAWDEPLLAFVRDLIRLRATEPALRHGTTRVAATAGDAVVIERRTATRTIVVAVNSGPSDAVLRFGPIGAVDDPLEDLIATDRGAVEVGPDGTLVVRLAPRSARILGRTGD